MSAALKATGRLTKKQKEAALALESWNMTTGTDDEVSARISERFDIVDYMIDECISGECRALVISGPAGLGKSFAVESAIEEFDPNGHRSTIVKGYVKPTGLFKLLFSHRHPGNVVVFDDADSIFADDTALNMIKAVTDTTERRRVSYMSEAILFDDDTNEKLPKTFEFEGTIIFITNLDFDHLIDKGHKYAPHLSAMVSRAHYVDLTLKTKQDYLVRIGQVIDQGLLDSKGLNDIQKIEVWNWIVDHADTLRELSLRVALKLADIVRGGKPNWSKVAETTLCRNR